MLLKYRCAKKIYFGVTKSIEYLSLIRVLWHNLMYDILTRYDWTKLNGKTVVDVGGSYGTTMENVANAFPDIGKCISLDTPEIIQIAPKPSNKKVRDTYLVIPTGVS